MMNMNMNLLSRDIFYFITLNFFLFFVTFKFLYKIQILGRSKWVMFNAAMIFYNKNLSLLCKHLQALNHLLRRYRKNTFVLFNSFSRIYLDYKQFIILKKSYYIYVPHNNRFIGLFHYQIFKQNRSLLISNSMPYVTLDRVVL